MLALLDLELCSCTASSGSSLILSISEGLRMQIDESSY
jgi:hypothetical protein